MTIGKKIQALRKEAHMTQEQLAEKMEVSATCIQKWEYDENTPTAENIKKLAQIFNVHPMSLAELIYSEAQLPRESGTDNFPAFLFTEKETMDILQHNSFSREEQDMFLMMYVYIHQNPRRAYYNRVTNSIGKGSGLGSKSQIVGIDWTSLAMLPYEFVQQKDMVSQIRLMENVNSKITDYETIKQQIMRQNDELYSIAHADKATIWRFIVRKKLFGTQLPNTKAEIFFHAIRNGTAEVESVLVFDRAYSLLIEDHDHNKASVHEEVRAYLDAHPDNALFYVRKDIDEDYVGIWEQYQKKMEAFTAHPELYDNVPNTPTIRYRYNAGLTDLGREVMDWIGDAF